MFFYFIFDETYILLVYAVTLRYNPNKFISSLSFVHIFYLINSAEHSLWLPRMLCVGGANPVNRKNAFRSDTFLAYSSDDIDF